MIHYLQLHTYPIANIDAAFLASTFVHIYGYLYVCMFVCLYVCMFKKGYISMNNGYVEC